MRFRLTPFCGPIGGLYPLGKKVESTVPLGVIGGPPVLPPSPPPPTPPVSCETASIFTECFSGATPGTINGGAPGPLNGWTFSEAFGVKGGAITFAPGIMIHDNTTGTAPGAVKSHTPLASISGITIQYEFTEYPLPIAARTYERFVTNTGFTQMVYVYMDESGFIGIYLGDPNNLDGYSGVWTPDGSTHKIHIIVDALNVPTLWIDDVSVPLNFDGTGFSGPGTLPSDVVATFSGGPTAPIQSSLQNFYVAPGSLPPTTVFCCP